MPTKDNISKYKLYNKLCDGLKECQIAWSKQNVIAISTLVKTIDDNRKVHYIPSIHIFKKVIALDKFLDRNKTITDVSGYSRIAKSSYYHKSEIVQLVWSDDGNYLASIDKDGCFCIWESKNYINEWNLWYCSEMKKPISCFTWLHSYNKFNIDPKSEYKYVNTMVGSKTINNVGFAILTNDGEVFVIMKNEQDVAQKVSTVFSEFEKNKKKNPVISHASAFLGEDNSLSYVVYCSELSTNHIILYNVSLNVDFANTPIKSRQLSRLKIDSIQNIQSINKNYRLMDVQLMNEKKMIVTFGINNKTMDKGFIGYICSFDLTDEMDITVGISWETNNTTFNDFIFGNKTWKLSASFEYKKTYPQYIKIITNSFNKHALLIQYENGTSEIRDCDTLKQITYYDWIFNNNIPAINNQFIEALNNYNKKHELEVKKNNQTTTTAELQDAQKKIKVEDDPMDIDDATFSTSIQNKKKEEDSFPDIDYTEKSLFENSYYYTSEIVFSPNGLVALTFEKVLNDIKFKVIEGNTIVDLLYSWEDQELAKKRIASRFEVGFYSDEQYYNLINTLVAQLIVAILNDDDYEDIIYFMIKINNYFKTKDFIGDFLVCFFNEYNKNVTLLDHDIISSFPRDETTSMAIEGQPFIVSLVFNRSYASREIQYFNNSMYIQLNYIGQAFLNHFVYPWRISKYLDKPILKIEESFEEFCAIKKDCFHYNAPLAYWIIELCKHVLQHLYLWYNINCRKRNRTQVLNNDEIVDEFINQPNYLPLILFPNSRRMLMRILNCINLYSINLYINFEKNSSMGKKAPDHDNLSYEEENYYISEFMNIILKNRMNLNELNKMLYEIDVKLKSLEKGYDLEYQISQIKNFIYNGTIPSYLESFVKKELKELYNFYIAKIFLCDNLEDAYTYLFSNSEVSYIEKEKMSQLISGLIYKNFVGLKLYGVGFSMENVSKKFENVNMEEPKKICSNLTDYQINNLPNTFFNDIVELNEVNINTSPNIYYDNIITPNTSSSPITTPTNTNTTTLPNNKSQAVIILENKLLMQYDILTKTSLHRAIGIRQCERCYHFSEIPHLEEFGGFPLVLPYSIINDDKKTHKKEASKSIKKVVMPSIGGENNNSGQNLYVFRGKAAWYRKYGRNCICGGRWRKW